MIGRKYDKTEEDKTKSFLTDVLLKEVIRQRRQSNIRTFAFILMFGFIFGLNYFGSKAVGTTGIEIPSGEDYVALIRIRGSVEPGASASPEYIEPSLTKAFLDEDAKGVLIMFNSPGGTAVQGLMLHDLIARLKEETGKKVVVFGEDLLTSGAYMASVAADKIFVTESTLTGSIGVIQQNYGYKEIAEKVGIESRAIFSGRYKHRLDPFSELKPEDVEKATKTMKTIHDNFISLVVNSRGDRIKQDDPLIFTGDFWAGEEALKLGLVDGVSDVHEVMQDEFQVKHALDYTTRKGVINAIGNMFVEVVLSKLSGDEMEVLFNQHVSLPR